MLWKRTFPAFENTHVLPIKVKSAENRVWTVWEKKKLVTTLQLPIGSCSGRSKIIQIYFHPLFSLSFYSCTIVPSFLSLTWSSNPPPPILRCSVFCRIFSRSIFNLSYTCNPLPVYFKCKMTRLKLKPLLALTSALDVTSQPSSERDRLD